MDWFRVYHGISTDPKLHKASRRAKVPRGLLLGAWIATLDFASQQEVRGNVADLDADTLAYLINQPASVAERILDSMQALGLIRDGSIAAWSKRQRESDDVAKRVREHRKRASSRVDSFDSISFGFPPHSVDNAKALKSNECDVAGNVTVTAQNRAEQNITEVVGVPPVSPPVNGVAHHAPEIAQLDLGQVIEKAEQPAKPESPPRASKRKTTERKPSVPLDDEWLPSEKDVDFARSEGFTDAEIAREARKFRNHYTNGTGRGRRCVDWSKTWENWIMRGADERNRSAPRSSGGGSGGFQRSRDNRPRGVSGAAADLYYEQKMAQSHH